MKLKTMVLLRVGILFSLLCSTLVQSQSEITGQISLNNQVLNECNIYNKRTGLGTISNNDGYFSIVVSIGDTLHFSHVIASPKDLIITKEELSGVHIELTKKVFSLDEVVLTNITARSLGITDNDKVLTPNERRLSNAGDFKTWHLVGLLGGSLPIEPIINKISGKTKKLKKYTEIDKKVYRVNFLLESFSTYLISNTKLTEDDLYLFCDFASEDEVVIKNIDEGQGDKIKIRLLQLYFSESSFSD